MGFVDLLAAADPRRIDDLQGNFSKINSAASGEGASLVKLHDAPGNWDAADLEAFAQEVADLSTHVNLLKFFTAAQRADYLARTAQTNYAAALDLSTPCQVAIYTTYAAGRNLYWPAGAAMR